MSFTTTFAPAVEICENELLHTVVRSPLLKRAVDIVGALAALTLFAPVFLATAIAIKMESSAPSSFVRRELAKTAFLSPW